MEDKDDKKWSWWDKLLKDMEHKQHEENPAAKIKIEPVNDPNPGLPKR